MRTLMMTTLLVLGACDGGADAVPADTAPIVVESFCDDYTQADTSALEELDDASTAQGRVVGRFIQGVVSDPNDPRFVSFIDYLIDNLDVGGQPTVGRTDAEGTFTETLGPGNWRIKTSGHQSSYYCAASYEFVVVGGKLSRLCVDMNCE